MHMCKYTHRHTHMHTLYDVHVEVRRQFVDVDSRYHVGLMSQD